MNWVANLPTSKGDSFALYSPVVVCPFWMLFFNNLSLTTRC